MPNRRRVLASTVFAAGILLAGTAFASETTPFMQGAFDAALAAGKPVLVDVSAPWCPTCRAQKPILSGLVAEPRFSGLRVFNVDFDSQGEALKRLRVRQQSTLIVYKGGQEVGRSTGDTDAASIAALVGKAL